MNVNKVVGFADDWFASRKFPMDMAGEHKNSAWDKSIDRVQLKTPPKNFN